MHNYFTHRKLRPQQLSIFIIVFLFLFIGPSHVQAAHEDGLLAARKGDYIAAFREFRSLAENGHAKSQRQLGIMYEMGLGIEKDYPKARKWYQKSAIQGDTEAQNRLIEMRQKALANTYPPPVPDNYQGSITDPQAQFDLGVIYFRSEGVEKDFTTAYRWFYKAADQGHVQAQNALAVMLSKGIGVRQNNAEAYIWFLKAAEQGLADSQFNLGLMLSNEKTKDMSHPFLLAYMWFEIAAKNGLLEARNSQVRLAKQMQKSQIKEAKDLARKWLLKHSATK